MLRGYKVLSSPACQGMGETCRRDSFCKVEPHPPPVRGSFPESLGQPLSYLATLCRVEDSPQCYYPLEFCSDTEKYLWTSPG